MKPTRIIGPELSGLMELLAKLPGLGPRSARRAALHLLSRQERLMLPLAAALNETAAKIGRCSECGTFDTIDPCAICSAPERNISLLCVVEEVADLWALEKSGAFSGLYHVLGGVLSALDNIGPDELNIASLIRRAETMPENGEIILALSATLDGQTTAHYLNDRLGETGVTITRIAHGVPVGGELDYLDDGTIAAALTARLGM